ncbi:type I DNA topoisomerase [Mycoplasma struthionis]|uniref:type I DNA topoisomerase n=1 Tax=Mycoplasma struthionis TaxID=538220 RepID=UPI001476050A|nr:type I DNA topoisomerase [Mycoplasma struthionis]
MSIANKVMIVESPNKVKTIQKYVGDDINVISCVGHILKMSTSGPEKLGIDFEKWEPKMVQDPTKKKIIEELKSAVKNANEVLIATDPDREGEAIANNLVNTLKIENIYKRIKYNEITAEAIDYSLKNPLKIDENLVKAQKARRMLDRIIGFKLSNLVKNKIKNSPVKPSAGRVQSIALKLVVDKEKEIEKFVPILYSKIDAKLVNGLEASFFYKKNQDFEGENTWISREKSQLIFDTLNKNKTLKVKDFKVSSRKEAAVTPFKQSILYKESKHSSETVQGSAQRLFENGLISYPRTDSTRLSDSFIQKARKYIKNTYGEEYVAKEIKGVSGAQDAHEAIRPTDVTLRPEDAKNKYDLSPVDAYTYELIYKKTLSALMNVPKREIYTYELENQGYFFRISASKVIFDGYYALTGYDNAFNLPKYKIGDVLDVEDFILSDKQTQPPARYTEGSLIKMLDDIKVGRPSTFATTVKIIKQRLFVENKNNALVPTAFGIAVLEKLIANFPTTINEEYTAIVEEQLDLISEGQANYKELMQTFWDIFNDKYLNVKDTVEVTVLAPEKLDEICPNCGSPLVYRYAKISKAKFIGCSNFPKCKFVKSAGEDQPKKRFWRFKKLSKNKAD